MTDQNLARGVFLAAVSLAFGLGAYMHYPLGTFNRAGPGLFPLMVSSLLLVIALAMIVRSRFVAPIAMHFSVKNIGLLMVALCGFATLSKLLDMAVGITFMVFVAGFAATSYSFKRNCIISASLIAVAFGFQHLLGLNLPLF
ncbi:tripartite tricarboxylate transporter TctB family protein [Ideonella azotifigens]|uniref:DUF1468 domain-containing protein n=1 Tax=Ideonella azotifigens TaxID=513160 RepID=A0ABP3VP12_9BURK|nr:tripartite tricarboxylate transporter TctB family protein [Ideonella azotifigens]MCD2340557.1 tripartite tricarboxylate transporter TctB family protein [Ideonella azotifigens]